MEDHVVSNGTATHKDPKTPPASADVDSLKADIAALKSDLKTLLSDAKGYAGRESSRQYERGKEVAEKAGDSALEYRDKTADTVRRHPFAAIGIAFGAGALLATLRRR